jgi:alpha-galactosidase
LAIANKKLFLVLMNRRHFIRISGASMATLMFRNVQGHPVPLINMPDEVWVQSGDQWFSMTVSGSSGWTYQDVFVELIHSQDSLPVQIQSPTLPVEAVKLIWKYASSRSVLCLGDHWERTYGDLSWRTLSLQKKAPWYLLVYDGVQTHCFGVATGCQTICYWQIDAEHLQLTLDTRSGGEGVQLGAGRLEAASIMTSTSGSGEIPFETGRRFCKLLCAKPVLPAMPVYGINDWYFAYGNNSRDLILKHTHFLVDLATDTNNRPFSVIDAGWAIKSPSAESDCCWGDDFSKSNDKFGDMSQLAHQIRGIGMRPGLWVRPLSASHTDKSNLLLPSIKGREDPKAPILDPTIPENLERIKHLIRIYRQWGYELVKHDYTSFDIFGRWGFEMTDSLTPGHWHFNDRTRTNAQVILQLYGAIRDAAEDVYLIGCNTMSHLSAGLFELNRTGDDTSGQDWQRTRKMGVNTLGFRIIQHRAFYSSDGDCVGITDKIPWEKNKQWMQLLAESSAPLFISAQQSAVGKEQKEWIKKSFTVAARAEPIGQPLDWLTNPFPALWKLNGRNISFHWD